MTGSTFPKRNCTLSPMSNAPAFVKYVSSVEGRAVPRFGTETKGQAAELIGARRVLMTKEQRRAGEAVIVWEPKRVIPLAEAYYLRFKREIDRAIRNGDLLERSAEDYATFRKAEEADAKKLADQARSEKAKADKANGGGKTSEG